MKSSHNSRFNTFYISNDNWMNDAAANVEETLKSRYSSFYLDDKPNFELLKEGVIKNNGKAKDFFKCLFRLPYVFDTSSNSTELLKLTWDIEQKYGHSIIAHGVEEAKGGGYSLLMMMVSNCVRALAQYWGTFQMGHPNISPLSHGPYFVIASIDAKHYSPRNNLPFDEVLYVLVPFEENKQILQEASLKLLEHNLITEDQCAMFSSKLISYEAFSILMATKIELQIETEAETKAEIETGQTVKQDIKYFNIEDLAKEEDDLDNAYSKKRISDHPRRSTKTSERHNNELKIKPRKLFADISENSALNEETDLSLSMPNIVPSQSSQVLAPLMIEDLARRKSKSQKNLLSIFNSSSNTDISFTPTTTTSTITTETKPATPTITTNNALANEETHRPLVRKRNIVINLFKDWHDSDNSDGLKDDQNRDRGPVDNNQPI